MKRHTQGNQPGITVNAWVAQFDPEALAEWLGTPAGSVLSTGTIGGSRLTHQAGLNPYFGFWLLHVDAAMRERCGLGLAEAYPHVEWYALYGDNVDPIDAARQVHEKEPKHHPGPLPPLPSMPLPEIPLKTPRSWWRRLIGEW